MKTTTTAMRALLAALLLAAVAAPAAAQPGARMNAQATAQLDGSVVIDFAPPPTHQTGCIYRYAPAPQEVLACLPGDVASWRLTPGGDANLRIAAGDTVEVRSYAARGVLLQATGARVRWRVWMPEVGR